MEGEMFESNKGSNNYDVFIGTFMSSQIDEKLVMKKTVIRGAVINIEETDYPSTKLYFLQKTLEGNSMGYYTGILNTTLTEIKISDINSLYNNEGFCIMSYISELGNGKGYSYVKFIGENISKLDPTIILNSSNNLLTDDTFTDDNKVSIDIYSCINFDENKCIEYFKKRFGMQKIKKNCTLLS